MFDKLDYLKFIHNNKTFLVLYDAINQPIGPDQLCKQFSDATYVPPSYLENEVKYRIAKLVEKSKKDKILFFDDTIARLDNWSSHSEKLQLQFSRTSYYHFAALNLGLDSMLDTISENKSLRRYLNENEYELFNSKLPNPLSVNLVVILQKDSKMVISSRGATTLEARNCYSLPVGGTVSLGSGDIDFAGFPDPFLTSMREAEEEIGLKIESKNIKFLGLGRSKLTYKPSLYGEIILDLNESELHHSWNNASAKFETSKMIFLDMNRKQIEKALQNTWDPVGGMALVASAKKNQIIS